MRSFRWCTSHQISLGDQMKNVMGGEFNMCGKRIDAYKVLWGELMEGDYFEDPGVDGRIIFRWILKT